MHSALPEDGQVNHIRGLAIPHRELQSHGIYIQTVEDRLSLAGSRRQVDTGCGRSEVHGIPHLTTTSLGKSHSHRARLGRELPMSSSHVGVPGSRRQRSFTICYRPTYRSARHASAFCVTNDSLRRVCCSSLALLGCRAWIGLRPPDSPPPFPTLLCPVLEPDPGLSTRSLRTLRSPGGQVCR